MVNHAWRRASHSLVILFVAGLCLSWAGDTRAQSAGQLPRAEEPQLAGPGDWAADFNQAQIACYRGSMQACDSIWLNNRVLLDSWLGQYGRTCGGRVNLRAMRRSDHNCRTAFPGNE